MVPLGAPEPAAEAQPRGRVKDCWSGINCENSSCQFRHPPGRKLPGQASLPTQQGSEREGTKVGKVSPTTTEVIHEVIQGTSNSRKTAPGVPQVTAMHATSEGPHGVAASATTPQAPENKPNKFAKKCRFGAKCNYKRCKYQHPPERNSTGAETAVPPAATSTTPAALANNEPPKGIVAANMEETLPKIEQPKLVLAADLEEQLLQQASVQQAQNFQATGQDAKTKGDKRHKQRTAAPPATALETLSPEQPVVQPAPSVTSSKHVGHDKVGASVQTAEPKPVTGTAAPKKQRKPKGRKATEVPPASPTNIASPVTVASTVAATTNAPTAADKVASMATVAKTEPKPTQRIGGKAKSKSAAEANIHATSSSNDPVAATKVEPSEEHKRPVHATKPAPPKPAKSIDNKPSPLNGIKAKSAAATTKTTTASKVGAQTVGKAGAAGGASRSDATKPYEIGSTSKTEANKAATVAPSTTKAVAAKANVSVHANGDRKVTVPYNNAEVPKNAHDKGEVGILRSNSNDKYIRKDEDQAVASKISFEEDSNGEKAEAGVAVKTSDSKEETEAEKKRRWQEELRLQRERAAEKTAQKKKKRHDRYVHDQERQKQEREERAKFWSDLTGRESRSTQIIISFLVADYCRQIPQVDKDTLLDDKDFCFMLLESARLVLLNVYGDLYPRRVVVKGATQSDLNDRTGTIQYYDEEKGKYCVELDTKKRTNSPVVFLATGELEALSVQNPKKQYQYHIVLKTPLSSSTMAELALLGPVHSFLRRSTLLNLVDREDYESEIRLIMMQIEAEVAAAQAQLEADKAERARRYAEYQEQARWRLREAEEARAWYGERRRQERFQPRANGHPYRCNCRICQEERRSDNFADFMSEFASFFGSFFGPGGPHFSHSGGGPRFFHSDDDDSEEDQGDQSKHVSKHKASAELLGVSVDSSLAEVKKAYRTMARKYHPDKFSAENHPDGTTKDEAEEMFKRVSDANEFLMAKFQEEEDDDDDEGVQQYYYASPFYRT